MIKLAIDVMGGDFAPLEIIKGVDLALKRFNDLELVLFGDETVIKANLEAKSRVKIVHAPDVINMGEKDPIGEIRRNKSSSLVMAFQAVKDKEVSGAVTAGPTQATVAAAHLIVRRIQGMKRTALCPTLPTLGGKTRYLLDVGANIELRSEHILQLAQYASIYMKETLGRKNPLVGLINIGSEPGKGRDLEKESYELLSNDENVNFYGNVEGKEIFSTECDILVTDGFTGNLIIKTCEGLAKAVGAFFKSEIKGFKRKAGYVLMKGAFKKFKKTLSADEIGGANLFGIDGIIVKAHGASSAYAFSNAIQQARLAVMGDVVEKMKKILSEGNTIE
jgi:glycerol-3-phosphate acyltransferase PlsX